MFSSLVVNGFVVLCSWLKIINDGGLAFESTEDGAAPAEAHSWSDLTRTYALENYITCQMGSATEVEEGPTSVELALIQ